MKHKFNYKLDWYTFKTKGLPSNSTIDFGRNETKGGLSLLVDIVRTFHKNKANGEPTFPLAHMLNEYVECDKCITQGHCDLL